MKVVAKMSEWLIVYKPQIEKVQNFVGQQKKRSDFRKVPIKNGTFKNFQSKPSDPFCGSQQPQFWKEECL